MNAREEFLRVTNGYKVICAILFQADVHHLEEDEQPWEHLLKKDYSHEEVQTFLQAIDFEYDSGYGGQEVNGCIWCEDGVWFDRGEYDGSEWWEKHQYPEIPNHLL
jgi:hypothetical protein